MHGKAVASGVQAVFSKAKSRAADLGWAAGSGCRPFMCVKAVHVHVHGLHSHQQNSNVIRRAFVESMLRESLGSGTQVDGLHFFGPNLFAKQKLKYQAGKGE